MFERRVLEIFKRQPSPGALRGQSKEPRPLRRLVNWEGGTEIRRWGVDTFTLRSRASTDQTSAQLLPELYHFKVGELQLMVICCGVKSLFKGM